MPYYFEIHERLSVKFDNETIVKRFLELVWNISVLK